MLESIKETPYDILIVSNGNYTPDLSYFNRQYDLIVNEWNGWEIGGIMRGKEKFDEQIHLMDTTVVKDISLFDKLFAIEGNVVLTKGNFHYQAKLVSKETPNLPRVHDKATAIMLEVRWLDGFKYTDFQPDLPVHSDHWEVVHGQNRMRIENEYIVKWKGTAWMSPEQVKELEEEINKKYPK
jgi:hypothetical protein